MGGIKILKASAGSGKTYQLSYRYIRHVVEYPWLYRHILAVTFTNKATEEMKSRIVNEINRLAKADGSPYLTDLQNDLRLSPEAIQKRAAEALTKILHDYSHFNVVTIDKFFQRIIRSFIKELGIDLSFSLELQTDSLLGVAADRLIDEIRSDKKLREWLTGLIDDRIEQNKKWDIKSEITSLGSEIFKERYKAISDGHLPPDELNRIVGGEIGKAHSVKEGMRRIATKALDLIASAGLTIADFAYGNQGVVSYFVKIASGNIEGYGKRVSDALVSEEKWYTKSSPRKNNIIPLVPTLQRMLQELCDTYDANRLRLTTTSLVQENFRSFALLERLAAKVVEVCAEQNIVPISETNSIIGKLIRGNDAPFIYEKTGSAISHFMIDEFQDTSAQQWQNFIPLLDNALSQNASSPVLLVGDVKQSIYRWRGGDWQILGRLVREQFPEVEEQNLDTNFRSAGVVVDFNNNIIERLVGRDNEYLNTIIENYRSQGSVSTECADFLRDMLQQAYEGHRQKSNKSASDGFVRIIETWKKSKDSEAASKEAVAATEKPLIINEIEELQSRGYRPGDIAILVRYNRESVAVAKELLDYKAAHPESAYSYDIVTQEALTIGNSTAVNFIIAVMRLASIPYDSIHRAIYNRFLHRSVETGLPDADREFIASLRLISLEEAFEQIVMRYRLGDNPNNVAYIQAMQNQVHNYASSKIADIPLFLHWWEENGRNQSINVPKSSDAITIITIHKAKGLQYKAVIIPYCSWPLAPKSRSLVWAQSGMAPLDVLGKVPLRWKNAIAESHFAEEYVNELTYSHIDSINTLYVAVTRAEEELHIIVPEGEKTDASIGGLLMASVTEEATRQDEYGAIYEFGKPYTKILTVPRPVMIPLYPTTLPGGKLRFGVDSERYFPEGENATLSPRNYGIIMHKVFENIGDAEQITTELDAMQTDGLISAGERSHVEAMISEAFENPLIKSWFAPKWDMVRNESNIVVPRRPRLRRPDRVLTKGTQAIVIDYKFGHSKKKYYSTQISEYMELLRGMGYRSIEGYIWYVELNEVEAVG